MDNEVFVKGHCVYCGQLRILGQDMGSQDAADTEATMTCTCEAGRQARRQAKECQIISGLFPELPEVTVDFLLQMAAMIREKQLYSGTSVKVAPNVTAKFKLKDGSVVVTRSEKMEHQYSI